MGRCWSRMGIKCHQWAWSAAPLPLPAWWLSTQADGCYPHIPSSTWKVGVSLLMCQMHLSSIMDKGFLPVLLPLKEKLHFCCSSWHAWFCGCDKVWWLSSSQAKDDNWTKATKQGVDILHSCWGSCLGLCTYHERTCWWVSSIYIYVLYTFDSISKVCMQTNQK